MTDRAREPAGSREPRQVKRLGRQRILARHGVTAWRGRAGAPASGPARLHEEGLADPDAIEAFWIARVREFLARRQAAPLVPRPRRPSPLRLTLDADRSLRSVFRELFRQAEDRDLIGRSRAHVGALLNHLVAAALDWEPPTIAERPDRLVTDACSSRLSSGATRSSSSRQAPAPRSRLPPGSGPGAASDPDHAGGDCGRDPPGRNRWHPGTGRSVRHRAIPDPRPLPPVPVPDRETASGAPPPDLPVQPDRGGRETDPSLRIRFRRTT